MSLPSVLGCAGRMVDSHLTISDAELLRRYRATRCQDAFAQIVARHSGMVYRTCLRLVGNAPDAEDAAQAAFVILAQRAEVITETLAGWLHKVARDVALNLLRGRARRSGREKVAARRSEVAATSDHLGAVREELDVALTRLPAPLREAVVLRYLEGHDQEQAAQLAGCPRGTLSRRASEGLDQLRHILARRGTLTAPAALLGILTQEATATAATPALAIPIGSPAPAVAALAQGTTAAALTTKIKVGIALGVVLVGIGVTAWLSRPTPVAARPSQGVFAGRGNYAVAYPAGSPVLFAGGLDDLVMAFEPGTGRQIRNLRVDGGCYSLAPSADGKSLAVGNFYGAVTIWDVAERKKKLEIPTAHIRNTVCVAYAPDGKTIASGGHDGLVRVWDAATGAKLMEFTGDVGKPVRKPIPSTKPGGLPMEVVFPEHIVWAVAYSPDSRLLACGGREGTVRVFDLAARSERAALRGHAELVYSLRFSPDGKLLASASGDRTVRLWDVERLSERAVLTGHTDMVHAVAFSPDGKLLASGSFDGSAKLWDVASRKERKTFKEPGYNMRVYSVAFTPDGRTLVASGDIRAYTLWPIEK